LANAYLNRGGAYANNGDLDRASADFTKAIELDPKYAAAYLIRGNLYGKKGDLDRAIADYTEAIRLNPKYALAYNNRGLDYLNKGDLDRAIADLDKAIELDPKFALAYLNRGNVYYKKADFDRAIADYDKAIELDSKFALAYYDRGNSYGKKGDLDRAIADYDKAIELDPKYARAYNNRGLAYERKGDLDRAIADYDKAIELNPKDAVAYNRRGAALRMKRIPQPLRPFVLPLSFAALVAFPFIYGAFKATEWKWWAEGIRLGRARDDLRFASDLRRGAFITNIWKLIGIYALVTFAVAILAGSIVFILRTTLGIDATIVATVQKSQTGAFLTFGAVGYFAYILALGVVWRIYMVQRIWKIVVSSINIQNLSSADRVTAKGEAATAIGEGLADSLDVAGF
jgi:tetratricopeptide (TPR) repeat protein